MKEVALGLANLLGILRAKRIGEGSVKMNWKSFSIVFVAVFGIVLSFGTADGALNAYMQVKGQKQGLIKGGVTQKGREGKILVIGASHEIVSPRDPATGQATGKRQHKPFTVMVEWDRALPNLYQALFGNEVLTEVNIDFFTAQLGGATGGGAEALYMTVRMTNASVASIRSVMPNNRMPETARLKEYAEISFTYQKIEYENKQGGTSATDSWIGGIARTEHSSPLAKAIGLN